MNIIADIDSVLASQREIELDVIVSTVFPDNGYDYEEIPGDPHGMGEDGVTCREAGCKYANVKISLEHVFISPYQSYAGSIPRRIETTRKDVVEGRVESAASSIAADIDIIKSGYFGTSVTPSSMYLVIIKYLTYVLGCVRAGIDFMDPIPWIYLHMEGESGLQP